MFEGKQSVISRARRDFLTGQAGKRKGHIASILVQAWPDKIAAVEKFLTGLDGVESHGSGGVGKLIITVETDDDASLVNTINRIETADSVITASLVYHHSEEMDDEK